METSVPSREVALGTPGPTGRQTPARLPFCLGIYHIILVAEVEAAAEPKGSRIPSLGEG